MIFHSNHPAILVLCVLFVNSIKGQECAQFIKSTQDNLGAVLCELISNIQPRLSQLFNAEGCVTCP